MGKRMRPHTLTVPKPLIPVGGKPIVQRLVEDITKVCGEKVDEIAFIIGPTFGKVVEAKLQCGEILKWQADSLNWGDTPRADRKIVKWRLAD